MKLFQERSPSTYAKAVKQDTCDAWSDGFTGFLLIKEKLSSLLKGNGVDCQVFWFPDANHGLETAQSERFGLEAILNFLQNVVSKNSTSP